MPEFTRTKAFAALADILALPGTDSLRLVDVSIATPVIDLREIIRAGLAQRYVFSRIFQHAGGATSDETIDPWVASGWSDITQGTRAGVAEPIPVGYEAQIMTLGGAASAAVSEVMIYTQSNNLTSSPRPISTLFWADRAEGSGTQRKLVNGTSGSEVRGLLPLLTDRTRSAQRLRTRIVSGGAADVTIMVELLAAPVGVLSVR